MNSVWWKILAMLMVFTFVLQQVGHYWQRYQQEQEQWSFNWTTDAQNLGLSSSQCDIAFPELYHEIDRAAKLWRDRAVTSESISLPTGNEGGVRVLLFNQQIRVLQTKGMFRKDFRTRITAVLHQLQRAVESADEGDDKPLPDTEFTIVVDDFATLPTSDNNHTLWSFTRDLDNARQEALWLIPDFNFWTSHITGQDFTEMQTAAREHDSRITNKQQQLVWRGVIWTAPKIRSSLLHITDDEPWADVKAVSWDDLTRTNFLAIDEFCDYAFVCNTEGRSWSSRLTYILNCDSVTVLHELRWATHYTHLLQPFHNFIPVRRDWADLRESMLHYLGDLAAAQEIADRARRTFREKYTTPAATACYWRRLLRTWAGVAFTPEMEDISVQEAGDSLRRPRGIAFEDYLKRNQNTDFPDPDPQDR